MLTPKDYTVREKRGYKTVIEMIENSCRIYGKKIAMQINRAGVYQKYTYEEVWNNLDNIAKALVKDHFTSGDRAAVYAENRPEWGMAYLGISRAGGIVVPLDAQLSVSELEHIIIHSGVKVVFVSGKYIENIMEISGSVRSLKKTICFDSVSEDTGITTLVKFLKTGEESRIHLPHKPKPDDSISILYTSGTTGVSKGVMLTQKNIIVDIDLAGQMIRFDENDTFLSVLPIHHIFECTCGFLLPLYGGCAITYADSLKSKSIINCIKETKVTIMLGVPLLFEKLCNGIIKAVKEKSLPVRTIFKSCICMVNLTKKLMNKKIGHSVFKNLREKAGLSSIRFFVSGGGPLREDVAEIFDNLGLTILQGYGLTETSPMVSLSTEKYLNYYSVGLPLPEIEVKIDEPGTDGIGEILIKGPIVMKGYYKNPEATNEVLKNGWFYTGDLGYIDKKGFMHITGRKKDVIVTSGGKNVYPEELEFKLDTSEFIAESLVYGMHVSEKDRGEKIYAIIVPDYEAIDLYGQKTGRSFDSEQEIQTLINHEVKRIDSILPVYKRISGFKIHSEELIKTSTKKIKRYLYLEKLIPVSKHKRNK
ncbi:MAG: AMP-binding protein [Elusimicrobia bacterium]|nr:AMP-binding protein [Elusimicrobiota bacterium]